MLLLLLTGVLKSRDAFMHHVSDAPSVTRRMSLIGGFEDDVSGSDSDSDSGDDSDKEKAAKKKKAANVRGPSVFWGR